MVSSYTYGLVNNTCILDRIIDLLTIELDITKEVSCKLEGSAQVILLLKAQSF